MANARRPVVAGPEGDRRWTAVLSLDMVGFTELSNRIGPEKVFSLIERVLGLARQAVVENGGHVVDTAGDGMLASFGAPVALENASLRACRAALSFKSSLQDDASVLEAEFGARPEFRAGLTGGNVMVARAEDGSIRLVGPPVNEASRLQELALPGEILISGTVQNEVDGFVESEARGRMEIRGFNNEIDVISLKGLKHTTTNFDGTRRRGLAEMVSRERDLARALDALGEGRANRTVMISGAPGIGKSRLAHEITLSLAEDRPVHVGQCTQGSNDYAPVLDILRQVAGVAPRAPRSECLKALFSRFPEIEEPQMAHGLLDPDGLRRDPSGQALRDRELLLNLLQGIQAMTKAVFIIEDAHWVDTATDSLIAALSRTDLCLVVTARPEYAGPWSAREGVTNIDLNPLAPEAIRRLVEFGCGKPLTDSLADLITGKSEGNPLMAEEIARSLRQSDRLVEAEGRIGLVAGDDGPLLSGNLEQLVLSRVDRLAPADKSALQTASAIGRDFSAALLSRALGRTVDLDAIAVTPGLVEARSDGQWRFAHALIRDAVYQSLLTGSRQAAHRAIAIAIEDEPGPGPETYAALASHFEAAGDASKSIPYLVRSAEQHLSAYALSDVDRVLTRVETALAGDPGLLGEEDFRLFVVVWLRALDQIGDYGKVTAVARWALPRLEAQGHSSSLGIARTFTAIAMTHARDYRGAEALAQRTLREATANGDTWAAAWAKIPLMRAYDETGWKDRDLIVRMADEIVPVAIETGDRQLEMNALYLLSSSYRSSGQRQKALDVSERLYGLSVHHNDKRAKAFALWAQAIVFVIDGSPEMALALGREARAAAIPGAADERVGRGLELFALTFLRPADELRPHVEALRAEAEAFRDYNIADSLEWTLALMDLRNGELASGWQRLGDMIPRFEEGGNQSILRQSLSLKSELLLGIAGLIDPEAEAPPERPRVDRKRPGLRDVMTFLRLKVGVLGRAEQVLQRALELDPLKRGPHFARCTIGIGLIASARRDFERAREHLERGLREAEAVENQVLANRARRALARMN